MLTFLRIPAGRKGNAAHSGGLEFFAAARKLRATALARVLEGVGANAGGFGAGGVAPNSAACRAVAELARALLVSESAPTLPILHLDVWVAWVGMCRGGVGTLSAPFLPIPTRRCRRNIRSCGLLLKIRTPSPWAQLTRCAPSPATVQGFSQRARDQILQNRTFLLATGQHQARGLICFI